MSTVRVPLTEGKLALIDAADADRVLCREWRAIPRGQRWYVVERHRTTPGIPFHVLLHRYLTSAPEGFDVDHINGDGLDNRRINLRICCRHQNMQNTRLTQRNTSGFKGVSFCRQTGMWTAQIRANGKQTSLGQFDTGEEAARVYDAAARMLFGSFARLNFPTSDERGVR